MARGYGLPGNPSQRVEVPSNHVLLKGYAKVYVCIYIYVYILCM